MNIAQLLSSMVQEIIMGDQRLASIIRWYTNSPVKSDKPTSRTVSACWRHPPYVSKNAFVTSKNNAVHYCGLVAFGRNIITISLSGDQLTFCGSDHKIELINPNCIEHLHAYTVETIRIRMTERDRETLKRDHNNPANGLLHS